MMMMMMMIMIQILNTLIGYRVFISQIAEYVETCCEYLQSFACSLLGGTTHREHFAIYRFASR